MLVDSRAARGPRIVLASRRARQVGVRPGMPLAEAQALAVHLRTLEQDTEGDRRALLELAESAQRYSPLVALEEEAEPQSLLLDISGCAGPFGGEEKLLQQAQQELTQAGWLVRLAIADTAGAAWALAHHAVCPCLAAPGRTETVLRPLPIAALRLPPETLALLGQLGLIRVGDLLSLPRPELAARFGVLLVQRLDQALGEVAEVIAPPAAAPALGAEEVLEFPVEHFEAVEALLHGLLQQLHQLLSRRNLGARLLECRLSHDTAPATVVEVGLYRPSACPRHLGALVRTRLEQVRLAEPVRAVRLTVALAEPLAELQGGFFDTGHGVEAGLIGLIDRLSGLLGEEAVTRPECVPDAQPEQAYRVQPMLRRPRTAQAAAPRRRRGRAPPAREPPWPMLPRPLTVWPEPVPVEVLAAYPDGSPQRFAWAGTEWRVLYSWGPERIETGWWRGADVRRDYYIVTTQAGSRFWMFRRREDRQWFLQGCFD